jgi:tRNA dimethylallyltransferase
MEDKMITILGTTATGKTRLAAQLAALIGGEIISADSRQVYRGMDLGTGKDLDDFTVDGKQIPYHLIDIVDAGYEFNVYEYQQHFFEAYKQVVERGSIPVLVGGSGMYIEAVLKGYRMAKVPRNEALRLRLAKKTDEELVAILLQNRVLHNTTDTSDRERTLRAIEIDEYYRGHPELLQDVPKISSVNFGIRFDRAEIRNRITERLDQRLNNGMVEEVQRLLDEGVSPEMLKFYGLEYKFITQYLLGELEYNEMFMLLNTAIHQFAKRQETWWRRMEKNGIRIHWLDGHISDQEKIALILGRLR